MTVASNLHAPEMDEQSYAHLASTSIGRVVITGNDDVSVVPVSYAVERDCLVFQLSSSLRKTMTDCNRLVFHADGVDSQTTEGWSVTVRGSYSSISGYGALAPPADFPSITPLWQENEEASVWIRLRPDDVDVRQSLRAG